VNWPKFCKRYTVAEDATVSFVEFLRIISTDDPRLIDPHFCPQYINLLYPIADLDFIGNLEDMDTVTRFLSEHGVPLHTLARRPTNAATRTDEYFGREEIEIAQRVYAKDFELYGYSFDPAQKRPVRSPERTDLTREVLGIIVLLHSELHLDTQRQHLGRLRALTEGRLEPDWINQLITPSPKTQDVRRIKKDIERGRTRPATPIKRSPPLGLFRAILEMGRSGIRAAASGLTRHAGSRPVDNVERAGNRAMTYRGAAIGDQTVDRQASGRPRSASQSGEVC
jgi:hypothetical protein